MSSYSLGQQAAIFISNHWKAILSAIFAIDTTAHSQRGSQEEEGEPVAPVTDKFLDFKELQELPQYASQWTNGESHRKIKPS